MVGSKDGAASVVDLSAAAAADADATKRAEDARLAEERVRQAKLAHDAALTRAQEAKREAREAGEQRDAAANRARLASERARERRC